MGGRLQLPTLSSVKEAAFRALAVSDNVFVGPSFHVGPFSRIWAPNRLDIGASVYIGKHVTIEVDGMIGDGTLIANNVGIVGRLDHDFRTIGVPVREAPWVGDDQGLSSNTVIGSDVWLGFGAVVLSGVTIGDSSIIAAGQIVRRDVPDNTIVIGSSPAEWRKRFSESDFHLHWTRMSARGVRKGSGRNVEQS